MNEAYQYNEIKTANENGLAVFKNLKDGTYIATSEEISGLKFRKEIVFTKYQNDKFYKKVSDLPLRAKIKFSSGKTFILMARNLVGHSANSATFVSEIAIEEYTWSNLRDTYKNSKVAMTILPSYYNELSQTEKETFVQYQCLTLEGDDRKNPVAVPSLFWLPSITECMPNESLMSDYRPESKSDLNFGNGDPYHEDDDRRRKNPQGIWVRWFTRSRSKIFYDNTRYVCTVSDLGDYTSNSGEIPCTAWIVPACDISQDAYVALDSDGYYRILGM